mmetsp:Transcript_48209/g.143929  ORF Transcript_48209/g.143929 Transcript_48209/m.143929 type:complete len:224 (+) Transcript_48209:252-923(+)
MDCRCCSSSPASGPTGRPSWRSFCMNASHCFLLSLSNSPLCWGCSRSRQGTGVTPRWISASLTEAGFSGELRLADGLMVPSSAWPARTPWLPLSMGTTKRFQTQPPAIAAPRPTPTIAMVRLACSSARIVMGGPPRRGTSPPCVMTEGTPEASSSSKASSRVAKSPSPKPYSGTSAQSATCGLTSPGRSRQWSLNSLYVPRNRAARATRSPTRPSSVGLSSVP